MFEDLNTSTQKVFRFLEVKVTLQYKLHVTAPEIESLIGDSELIVPMRIKTLKLYQTKAVDAESRIQKLMCH